MNGVILTQISRSHETKKTKERVSAYLVSLAVIVWPRHATRVTRSNSDGDKGVLGS